MKKLMMLVLLTCTLTACSHMQSDQQVSDAVDTVEVNDKVSKEVNRKVTEGNTLDEELTINTNNLDVLTWVHTDYSNEREIQYSFSLNEVTRDFVLNVYESDEGQSYKYTGKIDVEIFNEIHSALVTAINDNDVSFDQSWFNQYKNNCGYFIWEVCKNDGYNGVYISIGKNKWGSNYADIDIDMNGELTYKEIFTNIYTWVNN